MNVKKRKKSDAPIFVAGGLIVIVSIVVFILLLTRDKGFFVDVVNPNGVSKGSPVIWQNACVGSVKKVREENGRFNIGFVLFSGFKKKVHADVKACPIKQSDTKNAVLLLVGGKDEAKPFLTAGSQRTGNSPISIRDCPRSILPSQTTSGRTTRCAERSQAVDPISVWWMEKG